MSLVYNRQYKDENLDMKLINIFITNAHTVSTGSYLFRSSVDIFFMFTAVTLFFLSSEFRSVLLLIHLASNFL